MWRGCVVLILLVLGPLSYGETNSIAFNRIIHGWTNYSTAFSATDATRDNEYASVAMLYTPPSDVRVREFAAIVIWYGMGAQRQDFDSFLFQVAIWSDLQRFIANPREGDIANISFSQPTGGSTTVPDATTRGGRPAYELRFDLSSANLLLTNCHTYLVGFNATTLQNQAGEIFVPTAPFEGTSDLQAGNIVPFGWIYLVNAGGNTIYSGQLATELRIDQLGTLPKLEVLRTKEEIQISWPATATCFQLEATESLGSEWLVPSEQPETQNGRAILNLPTGGVSRFFRLRQITE
jgi:hypothetical protein